MTSGLASETTGTKEKPLIYGLMAEFISPEDLLAAARRTHQEGYRRMDAYSPLPIEGLSEAIGFHRTRVPLIVLLGGIAGCLGGFLLQYWIAVIYYPINVGGRPLNSWPSFIPVTFEMTILLAATSAVLGMLLLNGLPMPYHPVFNVPRFELATKNRFFLCIEARDPKFERERTRQFLEGLGSQGVYDVEN
jgi:ActD protein